MERKNTKKTKAKKSEKKVNKFKWLKLIVALLILVSIIALIWYGIWCIVVNTKYSYYKEKMEWYNLDKLYDNESASSTQKVNKDEIAKMTFGVVLNETDKNYAKEKLGTLENQELDTNSAWLQYAARYGIQGIALDDFKARASKIDAAIYLVQEIERFVGQEIQITESMNDKLAEKIEDGKEEYINKAISIGILENKSSDINDSKLIKGELNKMLITVVEKYSTVYYNSLYGQNEDQVKVVTDEEKMPINYDIYPYILDNIDKEIYEITTENMNLTISKNPKQVYDVYNEEYTNTAKNISNYFNAILNVNYINIDKEKFINSINKYLVYSLNIKVGDDWVYRDDIEKYVDYVVANKIILKGNITPLLPIIYSDGLLHYLRCKIDIQVVSSNTTSNLLLWDKDTTYTGKTIEVYVDVPVSPTYYSKAFRVLNGYSLMEYIVKTDGNVEVK